MRADVQPQRRGTVLLIEDDAQIRKFLRISLEANGYAVREARLAADGLAMCAETPFDVVVLDLGLPDMDGKEVLVRLREWSSVAVIVLSVRADDAEKVAVLDAGANDYVTKPFSVLELMARIRALQRSAQSGRQSVATQFRCGDLEIDFAKRRVSRGGVEIKMSRKEYQLLRLLADNAGLVLTHAQLLRDIWGPAHAGDVHYLRVLVGHLREKLGDEAPQPRFVHTVQGIGYRFSEP
jgi:two-component system KDP operon response regulator KdpE